MVGGVCPTLVTVRVPYLDPPDDIGPALHTNGIELVGRGPKPAGGVGEPEAQELPLEPPPLEAAEQERRAARQLAMYLCRRLLGTSFPEIGELFPGHGSVEGGRVPLFSN